MEQAPFNVVLDANVLFPFTLRDTLLRAAAMDLYQVYWSEEILSEMSRNLIVTGRANPKQVEHLLAQIRRAFPAAVVSGYESLIPFMENDIKDRHVTAAAVTCGAQVIVTSNLRDFRNLPEAIEALSPDSFLMHLLELEPDTMLRLLQVQADNLKNPPQSLSQLLAGLGTVVPQFEREVRGLIGLL